MSQFAMSQRKNRRRSYLLSLISLGLIFLFIAWLYQSPMVKAPQSSSGGCPEPANFVDSDGWQISSSDISIRTLWQKTQDRPILTQFNGYENSGIAALSDQVVFHAVLPSCLGQEIVSFDLFTGVPKWRYPFSQDYSRPYEGLRALNDGVLLVLDGILIKFDPDGQYVWSNEGFPSHALNIVYVDQDLYFPSKDKFYVVSNVTGQRLQQIDSLNPISVLHGNIITAVDESHLQVVSAGGQKSFVIPVNDTAAISVAAYAPFTDVFGDTLLIYDQFGHERSIEAYSFVDGNLIWRSDDYFEGIPVVSNNHLFVYGNLKIKIIDITTGDQMGSIDLAGKGERQLNLRPYSVWMAAYDNILIVNVRDTWDIIALEIQVADLS